MFDSLRPHGLYRPWNSPGQNTGVGSLSLLKEDLPKPGIKPGLPHCRPILYQLKHKGSPNFVQRRKKKKRNQTLVVVSSCHWRERDKTSDTGSLFPPSGDPWPSCLLPSHEPKVEPRSPTLQGDSLLSEPPGRHGIDFPALRDLECVG